MQPQPPSPSQTRALLAALPLTVLCVWGCNLVESAQADKVVAATVLATPPTDLKFLLPDASIPSFDAAIPYSIPDVGIPTVVPAQTAAQIFFGQRASDPTAQPTGIAGATATLSIAGKPFVLQDQGSGTYGLTTQQDPTLLYQENEKLNLSIVSGGVTYTATVVAPAKNVIEQFEAVGNTVLEHTANTELKLTRRDTDNVAFTSVIEVNQDTLLSDLKSIPATYTDIPTTPLDLLDLIANDSLWKRKIITLPATAFPHANTYYVVTIAAVKRGETSNNIFTASAFLVGKADVGFVKTK